MKSNYKSKGKVKGKKRIIIAVMALIMLCAGGASAIGIGGLPELVYDPQIQATINQVSAIAEKTKYAHFIETVSWIQKQYTQLLKTQKYWEAIHGNWKDPAALAATVTQTTLASHGIEVDELGWAKQDTFAKNPATKITALALSEMQKLMSGKEKREGLEKVRGSIEEVYGDVPVTRAGAPVEATYRSMAKSAAFNGDSRRAIEEMLVSADSIKQQIDGPDLTPGDRDRLMVEESDLRFRAQILQAQQSAHTNELLIQIAGLKAAEEGRTERGRLKDRDQRFEFGKIVMFSPAIQPGDGKE